MTATEELGALMRQCIAEPGVHIIDCPVDYSQNDRKLNQDIRRLSEQL